MELACRLIGKMTFPDDSVSMEEVACAAWPAAVTRLIARHARAERLVRTKLIIAVDDAVWQRQLFTMSGLILANLTKRLGPGIVEDLEFRVAPARRGPQRASRAIPANPDDEAERIGDPGLRRIYVAARKRELA